MSNTYNNGELHAHTPNHREDRRWQKFMAEIAYETCIHHIDGAKRHSPGCPLKDA